MKQSDAIFTHFWQLGKLMRRRMSKAVTLSLPQLEALHFVAEHESPTMRELAEYLKVKAPTATALAAELVRAGLLRRVSGKDRRVIALSLTPRGKREFAATLRARKRVVAKMLAGLSARERAQFDRLLESILITNRDQ